ncbi:hypothetical protein BSKO_12642 [Bryopsis sp. KO-2023]|nr:hypothetical protein BSKO_12642 [Bryopsis sp. KO-2023]
MDRTASMPWCNANTVGRPLIRFLKEKRNDGENFGEWILTLRALNKSWYLEMTSHIQKTLNLANVTKTEFGSLIPMNSVKNLSINHTTLAIVEKCPNLENLFIVDCSLKKTKFRIYWRSFGLPTNEFNHGFLNALPPSLRELEVWGLLSWADNRLLMGKTTSLYFLEKLALGNGEGRVGYGDLEWLTKLPNLVELSLWGREVGARGIVRLSEMPKLRRLALNVESITPEALQQLCLVGDSVQQIMVNQQTFVVEKKTLKLIQ